MYKSKQMIVIRRDLKMRKGKIAAQAGHACVDAVLRALLREGRLADIREENGHISLAPSDKPETPLSQWFAAGTAKSASTSTRRRNCSPSIKRRRDRASSLPSSGTPA